MQSLGQPASFNEINLDYFREGSEINTSTRPFTFYHVDDCGNDTPADLTGLSFVFRVLLNDCVQYETNTAGGLLPTQDNQLWLDLGALTLRAGQYTYELNLDTGEGIIIGNFILK